jgi:transcriptional regulator NrdR family protein
MTSDRTKCPYCANYDTHQIHKKWFSDAIDEVRVCNNCLTKFVNRFDLSEKSDMETDE